MNKQMIVLIALVAAVFAVPVSAETVEVRGEVVNLAGAQDADLVWNACNFGAFWYDLDDGLSTETLTIAATDEWGNPTLDFNVGDRTLDEDCLIYQTAPVYQEYEVYAYEGLTVGGDTGYYLEGFMGGKYVAINGKADKLCELLVEFEDGSAKLLCTSEEWDLGGGFTLAVDHIYPEDNEVEFTLNKNGDELYNEVVSGGEVYTYTADLAGECSIPVFSCYVYCMSMGSDFDVVQIEYVFLIDNDVLEIECGDEFGVMEVMTASSSQVILINDKTTIDLDEGSVEHIMGDMCFMIADDESAIRFYPMVEHYILSDVDADGDGVPDAWDLDSSTPDGYWVNSDGIGRMWGDMNGDDKLTSVDALMILQAAVGTIDL